LNDALVNRVVKECAIAGATGEKMLESLCRCLLDDRDHWKQLHLELVQKMTRPSFEYQKKDPQP
jgi:hypothetical protein